MSEGSNGTGGGAMGGGVRVLRAGAYLVIVVAGVKLAGKVLVPVVVAAFIAIVCVPIAGFLKRRVRLPGWLAYVVVLVVVLGAILGVTAAVVDSLTAFSADLPAYRESLKGLANDAAAWLQERGVRLAPRARTEGLDPGRVLNTVTAAAGTVVDALASVFLVLLIVIFMLAEAAGLPEKIRRAVGKEDADLSDFKAIGEQVWAYLGIKTVLSLVTGVLWGAWLAFVGVDYPVLWGLVAFLMNFIPNIGSVIAAVPPVLLALIQPGLETSGVMTMPAGLGAAAVTLAGNLVVNQVLGNVVEPKVMGAKLGLSPLVVFLSLLFWSWMWGPIGMLLSVPLTMIVKILFDNFEDTRWIAVLLGPSDAS